MCNFLQAKRQQRKLNFLITQTELYAHFMARKITGENETTKDKILRKLEEPKEERQSSGYLVDTAVDDYGEYRVTDFKTADA